jgi:transcriptional regulator GlxA family with amidase domain
LGALTYAALAVETLNCNERVADVALACRLSRGSFIRGFKVATGKAPHQWLLSRRVEQARNLLIKTDTPLAAVALACGFADRSHFSRVFGRDRATAGGLAPRNWQFRFSSATF